mmetsp:Transcript_11335/g.30187  ORF Transcript_11335/g.30187 Transcript_11335/m.30187 type:complete len:251 (-) Transcript_11335:698-1450(-)
MRSFTLISKHHWKDPRSEGSAHLAETPRRPTRTVTSPIRRLWGNAVKAARTEHAGCLRQRRRVADERELPHGVARGHERRHRRRAEAAGARFPLGPDVGGGHGLVRARRRDHTMLVDGHVDAALPPSAEAWSLLDTPSRRHSVIARTRSHAARVDAAGAWNHLLLKHPAHAPLLQQHEGVALLVALSCSHLFGGHAIMYLPRRLVTAVGALRGLRYHGGPVHLRRRGRLSGPADGRGRCIALLLALTPDF